ncbi:DUF1931 domain-containing protein [Candidatus Woesearchaeota archaeon]|nr:DUF1931 domain-containing protein [Candidatus Woesearchaeota archaeon]
MSLVARSRIKEIVGDFNIGSDFFPALDREVENIITKAVMRAKENKRRTLMARDI